jgi:uncharacterized protein
MGDISSDPSMEDILSSIKKIIADDTMKAIAPRLRVGDVNPDALVTQDDGAAEQDDVLDLIESEDEAEATNEAPNHDLPIPAKRDSIVSAETHAESRMAFDSLSRLAASEAAAPANVDATVIEANPIEDMVREMLRPMLKDWLDAHMPDIVRNAVTQEVARIAGRNV